MSEAEDFTNETELTDAESDIEYAPEQEDDVEQETSANEYEPTDSKTGEDINALEIPEIDPALQAVLDHMGGEAKDWTTGKSGEDGHWWDGSNIRDAEGEIYVNPDKATHEQTLAQFRDAEASPYAFVPDFTKQEEDKETIFVTHLYLDRETGKINWAQHERETPRDKDEEQWTPPTDQDRDVESHAAPWEPSEYISANDTVIHSLEYAEDLFASVEEIMSLSETEPEAVRIFFEEERDGKAARVETATSTPIVEIAPTNDMEAAKSAPPVSLEAVVSELLAGDLLVLGEIEEAPVAAETTEWVAAVAQAETATVVPMHTEEITEENTAVSAVTETEAETVHPEAAADTGIEIQNDVVVEMSAPKEQDVQHEVVPILSHSDTFEPHTLAPVTEPSTEVVERHTLEHADETREMVAAFDSEPHAMLTVAEEPVLIQDVANRETAAALPETLHAEVIDSAPTEMMHHDAVAEKMQTEGELEELVDKLVVAEPLVVETVQETTADEIAEDMLLEVNEAIAEVLNVVVEEHVDVTEATPTAEVQEIQDVVERFSEPALRRDAIAEPVELVSGLEQSSTTEIPAESEPVDTSIQVRDAIAEVEATAIDVQDVVVPGEVVADELETTATSAQSEPTITTENIEHLMTERAVGGQERDTEKERTLFTQKESEEMMAVVSPSAKPEQEVLPHEAEAIFRALSVGSPSVHETSTTRIAFGPQPGRIPNAAAARYAQGSSTRSANNDNSLYGIRLEIEDRLAA